MNWYLVQSLPLDGPGGKIRGHVRAASPVEALGAVLPADATISIEREGRNKAHATVTKDGDAARAYEAVKVDGPAAFKARRKAR